MQGSVWWLILKYQSIKNTFTLYKYMCTFSNFKVKNRLVNFGFGFVLCGTGTRERSLSVNHTFPSIPPPPPPVGTRSRYPLWPPEPVRWRGVLPGADPLGLYQLLAVWDRGTLLQRPERPSVLGNHRSESTGFIPLAHLHRLGAGNLAY